MGIVPKRGLAKARSPAIAGFEVTENSHSWFLARATLCNRIVANPMPVIAVAIES